MNSSAPRIYVLGGVNGAGKSSLGGAIFRASKADYFNPDEAAQKIRKQNPQMSVAEANSMAWKSGKSLLERAIREKLNFALETTLGGNTITSLLAKAAHSGHELHIWYVGLNSVEIHLERVRCRVIEGGHDIPEIDIRRRWDHTRLNLIRLLPFLTRLQLFDNSFEADPSDGLQPAPRLILSWAGRKIIAPEHLGTTPDWAKPIVAAALKLAG